MNQLTEEQRKRVKRIREERLALDQMEVSTNWLRQAYCEHVDFFLLLLGKETTPAEPVILRRGNKEFTEREVIKMARSCIDAHCDSELKTKAGWLLLCLEQRARTSEDAATAMRDACVEKVREYLTDCRDEEKGIIEAIASELESLTLDQVQEKR